jgi:predicted HD phosphohydrolase
VQGKFGVHGHDLIGADYLRQLGFSCEICELVGSHVAAKRYLVATSPDYQGKLSPASLQTLKFQGGPMNQQEIEKFQQNQLFQQMLDLRRCDELAKNVDAIVPELDDYRTIITQHLMSQKIGRSHPQEGSQNQKASEVLDNNGEILLG